MWPTLVRCGHPCGHPWRNVAALVKHGHPADCSGPMGATGGARTGGTSAPRRFFAACSATLVRCGHPSAVRPPWRNMAGHPGAMWPPRCNMATLVQCGHPGGWLRSGPGPRRSRPRCASERWLTPKKRKRKRKKKSKARSAAVDARGADAQHADRAHVDLLELLREVHRLFAQTTRRIYKRAVFMSMRYFLGARGIYMRAVGVGARRLYARGMCRRAVFVFTGARYL